MIEEGVLNRRGLPHLFIKVPNTHCTIGGGSIK